MLPNDPAAETGLRKSIYRRALSSDMLRHGALVMAASTFANACGFLFQAIVSRKLGVASDGSLYALLSLISIASLPAGIFTTVVAKFAAEFRTLDDPAHLRALALGIFKVFGIGSIFYVMCGLILATPVAVFLHVPSWEVVFAAGIAGLGVLGPVLRAVAQGTQDFVGFSASTAIDGAARAAFGPLLTAVKLGVAGGLLAVLAGIALGGLYVGRRLWIQYANAVSAPLHIDWRRVVATTAGAAALTVSLTVLSYGDVILVRHFFSAHDAGIYAAASLGGKILLFLVGFAPMVLVPKAVDRHNRGQDSKPVLAGALFIVLLLSTLGLVAFHLGANLILHSLVGGSFAAASGLLIWYGLAMALLAVTNVVASYAIALHRTGFSVPLIIVTAAEISAIALRHPSLVSVVMLLVAGNGVALVAVSATFFVETARQRA